MMFFNPFIPVNENNFRADMLGGEEHLPSRVSSTSTSTSTSTSSSTSTFALQRCTHQEELRKKIYKYK